MPRRSVLLVEDCPDSLKLLQERFEANGYEVYVSADGARALEVLEWGSPPDAVVLDLELPNVKGTEVLRYVRADPELDWLPIVVVTGSNKVPLEADVVVRKPVPPQEVVSVVEALSRDVTPAW